MLIQWKNSEEVTQWFDKIENKKTEMLYMPRCSGVLSVYNEEAFVRRYRICKKKIHKYHDRRN